MVDVLAVLKADTSQFSARMAEAKGEMKDLSDSGSGSMSKFATAGKYALIGIGTAAVAAGAYSVDMGMKFQTAMTQLVTGAGESQKNIKLVTNGILDMAGQTGTSALQLAQGMYLVESAGFHGAQGLTVLKAAAEGAKVGNADLSTVADAVTSALNAYGLKARSATDVTNELVETVASGKTHMQDLGNALSAVLPTAAAAHISLAQVGGAIATMTSQGVSAQEAANELANSIRSLQNPSEVQIGEMEQLGLNANQVSTQLGKRGLTGTLNEVVGAITKSMGPAGTVLLNTFKQSQSAVQDANIMLKALPSSLQSVAQAFMQGHVTVQQWRTDVKAMPADQQALATQFASMVQKTQSFNSALAGGSPAAQTFNAALSKMMGGATGLNTALLLTGSHMSAFKDNVAAIGKSGSAAGTQVQGFAQVQKDLSFQIDQAKDAAQALAIRLGLVLIPIIQSVIKITASVVAWFLKHKDAAIALGVVIGGVLTTAIAAYVVLTGVKFVRATQEAIESVSDFVQGAADAAMGMSSMAMAVASNLASMASQFASWVAEQAAQLAESAANTATWIAEHTVAAATFIAENVAMAASATAAFIAENAATLGIIAGIVALVAGIVWMATHWKETWRIVMDVVHDAWEFIHPIFNFIKTLGLDYIRIYVDVLKLEWQAAWTVISTVLQAAWAVLQPVFNFIKTLGIDLISNEIRGLQVIWNAVWSAISGAVQVAWSAINSYIQVGIGFIKAVPGDVEAVFKDAGTWLYDAGKDIIQGLVNGLSSAEHFVLDKIKSIGSDIVNGFKSVLGISSPSTVFYQHGMFMMQGLANGILAYGSLASSAVRSVAGSLIPNAGAYGASSITPITSGASYGGAPAGQTAQVFVSFEVDGATFVRGIQTAVLQYGRGVPTVFGAAA